MQYTSVNIGQIGDLEDVPQIKDGSHYVVSVFPTRGALTLTVVLASNATPAPVEDKPAKKSVGKEKE